MHLTMTTSSKLLNSKPSSLLCVFLLLVAFSAPGQAQSFGSLFTTPQEREYLDYLREEFLANNQARDFNIVETPPTIPVVEEVVTGPSHYTLGGIITQRDGSRIVWLNNSTMREQDLPGNMQVLSSGGSLLLRISIDQGNFNLRPGQILDIANGRISEAYQTTLNRPEATNAIPAPVPVLTAPEANPEQSNGALQTDTAASSLQDLPANFSSILSEADPQELAEFIEALQAIQASQGSQNAP